MATLTIIANITAKADKIDEVKAELLKLIAPTREEKGCITYKLHQDNKNPAHFLFYEQWESQELLQVHLESEHLKHFSAVTEGALADFTINEMTPVA